MRKLVLNRRNNAFIQMQMTQFSGHRSTKIFILIFSNCTQVSVPIVPNVTVTHEENAVGIVET